MSVPSRPMRKDAARNRELLLQAARVVFAERGLEASLDDIAHRAGVGIGTAYRHFANKQEVANALFAETIDSMVADAETALAMDDPWQSLVAFFEGAAERQANDRGLHEVFMGYAAPNHSQSVRERLTVPVTAIFERAQAAGIVRPDADPTDSGPIFAMLGAVFELDSPTVPDLWRRYLALLLDGLCSTGRGPLPVPPLTMDELEVSMAAAKKH